MADVKWIKIAVDIFDDEKILLIEQMPDSYAIITVWFKLLCLAGKQNNSGVLIMNERIAYTDEMLAAIFRMNKNTVLMALSLFEQFGMIERIDGVVTIPNWGKHQTLDKIEKQKAYHRTYMRKQREKQKLIAQGKALDCDVNSDVNSELNSEGNVKGAELEEELELELEKEEELEGDINISHSVDFTPFVNAWNELADELNLARITKLNDKRRKKLKARLKEHKAEGFTQALDEIRNSDFLQGKTGGWKVSFDWLIENETNIQKVLEGNYRGKKLSPTEVLASTFIDEDDWRY